MQTVCGGWQNAAAAAATAATAAAARFLTEFSRVYDRLHVYWTQMHAMAAFWAEIFYKTDEPSRISLITLATAPVWVINVIFKCRCHVVHTIPWMPFETVFFRSEVTWPIKAVALGVNYLSLLQEKFWKSGIILALRETNFNSKFKF